MKEKKRKFGGRINEMRAGRKKIPFERICIHLMEKNIDLAESKTRFIVIKYFIICLLEEKQMASFHLCLSNRRTNGGRLIYV